MPLAPPASALDTWQTANREHHRAELERLRLRLGRLTLWLRAESRTDPVHEYRERIISDAEADRLLAGDAVARRSAFYRDDRETAALTSRLARAERALLQIRRRMTRVGAPAALDRLTAVFGLTPFERDVVWLGVAPEIEPGLSRLYGYAQDDATRRHPTAALALTLFTETVDEAATARNAFAPASTLRRLRLITVDATSATVPLVLAPIRVEERIADYVRGLNQIDSRVTGVVRPVPAEPLSRDHAAICDRLVPLLEGPAAWPLINLIGSEEHGARGLARAISDRLGRRLAAVDLGQLASMAPTDRADILAVLAREAVLLKLAFYLSGAAVVAPDGSGVTAVEAAEQLGAPSFLSTHDRWLGHRPVLAVPVPRPAAGAQRELWHGAINQAGPIAQVQAERLSQQFDFGAREISHTAIAARQRAQLRGDPGPTLEDFWTSAREQAAGRLDDLVQRIEPAQRWQDLVLPRGVAAQLEEIAAQVHHRTQVYDAWGFGARLSRGRGISALFSGPSGTGKTMAAEVLANQLSLDLWSIDLAGVVSKYIGETERNLRRVFDAAEQGGVLLFFDEADALFGKRTEVKDSHDRYANIEVNYLLQRMENYRGLAILASNRKSGMDRAFLRRLRFLVDFPFPDVDARRLIWRQVFPSEAEVEALDYEQLARTELPGGNIKNIAVNAAFLAAREARPISMPHIIAAAARECAKVDKAVGPEDFRPPSERVRA